MQSEGRKLSKILIPRSLSHVRSYPIPVLGYHFASSHQFCHFFWNPRSKNIFDEKKIVRSHSFVFCGPKWESEQCLDFEFLGCEKGEDQARRSSRFRSWMIQSIIPIFPAAERWRGNHWMCQIKCGGMDCGGGKNDEDHNVISKPPKDFAKKDGEIFSGIWISVPFPFKLKALRHATYIIISIQMCITRKTQFHFRHLTYRCIRALSQRVTILPHNYPLSHSKSEVIENIRYPNVKFLL